MLMVYGPATPAIRQFLLQLSGLGDVARDDVVQRHATCATSPAYISAEVTLGETVEFAGRTDARDALAGPLLQLVRTGDATPNDLEPLTSLAPIAEPALAALLALLVADLLPSDVVETLYAPFADALPFSTLGVGERTA